jgi:subtilisin-like proprotein convertase family protein
MGRGITTTDNEIHGSGFTENSEYTDRFGGTSSATPLVAGIASLVISANPNLKAKEVKEILQNTADKIIDTDADPILRTRKGTYDDNGHSEWFGYGKVNAYRAVKKALDILNGMTTIPIQITASPNIDIPDNNPVGVQSTLTVSEGGKIDDIKVSIDITHNYIGDLLLTLISPQGEKAVLHNRTGARTHDIKKKYGISDTKSLRSLLLKDVAGTWALEVADMVKKDTGRLNSWRLEIMAASSENNMVRREIVPEVTDIPDNNPAGIESSINIDKDKKIKDIKVTMDIIHSWIGDLTVDLVSPAGTSVRLHNREGRSSDKIVKTYTPQLRQILGENAKGEWILKVADLAAEDEGDLNKWGLEINLES